MITIVLRRDLAPAAAHVCEELRGSIPVAGVIIDRRYGERRRSDSGVAGERRRADRRVRGNAERLREQGWAIVSGEPHSPYPTSST